MKSFFVLLLFFCFMFPALPYAAEKTPQTLQENLVNIEDGHFLINKYLSCSLSLPPSLGGGTPFNTFSMHVRFQAPAKGLISRDIFVALSMRLFTESSIRLAAQIPGLNTEQTLRAMQCKEIFEKTNTTAYSYFVNMNKRGLESRIKDTQRNTEQIRREPWDAVLRNLPKVK